MKEKTIYRLEIAPLTVVNQSRSPLFTYASAGVIPKGSLVRISFGRQHLYGIVFAISPLPGRVPPWMKFVETVIAERHLTDAQLELALFLSETYFTPLGNCLKHFLVLPTKRKKEVSEPALFTPQAFTLNLEEKKAVKALTGKSKATTFLSVTSFSRTRNILLGFLMKKREGKGQILFLVPELLLASWWSDELSHFFAPEDIVVLHSKLKKSEEAAAWERIRSGKARIIMGTRKALFAPYRSLDSILITDEEDTVSYKQWEMSPRYSVRRVAEFLATLTKARLILASPTPSLETVDGIATKELKDISAREIFAPPLGLVNLRFEKKKERDALLTPLVKDALKETLKRGEKALIIGKQQGMSSFSVCKGCRTVLRCPKCEKALVGDSRGFYRCPACGYHTDIFPSCRSCHQMTFLNYGAGTESIERQVHQSFPKARLLRLDRESHKKAADLSRLVALLKAGKYDVLIGTPILAKVPNLPKTSLIAMLEADGLLAFPDYQAEEKLLAILERLRLLASETKGGKVVVQSFEPEHTVFRIGERGSSFRDLVQKEKEARLRLHYPPFFRFIKIECLGKTEAESKETAQAIEKSVRDFSKQENVPIEIIPPHQPLKASKEKRFQLFLRFPKTFILPPKLILLLKRFAGKAILDPEPLSLN